MNSLSPTLRGALALILGIALALGRHMPHGHDHGSLPTAAIGETSEDGEFAQGNCELVEAHGCCDPGDGTGDHGHGHGSGEGDGGCGGEDEHPEHVDPFCQLCSVSGELPVGLGFVLVGVGSASPGIPAEPRELRSVIETGPDVARGPPREMGPTVSPFQA